MRVLVTGATGFIGSAVVKELLNAGHDVVGLARSEESAKAVLVAGAKVHRGSIEDLESLRSAAASVDGVIHTAFFHAITHSSIQTRMQVILGGSPGGIIQRFTKAAVDTDRRAIETLGSVLSSRPNSSLVAIFATMSLKPGRLGTEEDAVDPNSAGGLRGQTESVMMDLASRGVRASIVRLPPTVHGEGDHGFIPTIIETARKEKFSAIVGDGLNHWPAVHRLDAACLLRLAFEKGLAGSRYHAVAEEGIQFKDIAEIIGRKLDVPVVSKSPKESGSLFSWLTPFVSADNLASSKLTQERLGWKPKRASLFSDLEQGGYFKT